MSIEIKFGVPKNQRETVAKMFHESFGDKYDLMFGDETKTVAFVSACLDDSKTIVALKDDVAVGFSGLQHCGKSFIEDNAHEMVRVFGLASFKVMLIRSMFVFKRMGIDNNELLLEALAVSAKERNKGIGQKLLQFTIDYAKSKKFSHLKLDVINTNPKAKRLYERIGFVESKVQKIPYPFNVIMGFDSMSEMVYQL